MKVTELGKWLRTERLKRNLLLGDLADAIGVPSSNLSSIEHGRRKPSIELGRKIQIALSLTDEEATEMFRLISNQITSFTLEPANDVEREAMLLFARYVSFLKPSDIDKIKDTLISGRSEDV